MLLRNISVVTMSYPDLYFMVLEDSNYIWFFFSSLALALWFTHANRDSNLVTWGNERLCFGVLGMAHTVTFFLN